MADSGQKTHTATAGVSATVQVDAVPPAQRSDGASDSEVRFRTSVNEAALSGGSSGMARTVEGSQVSELSYTNQELKRLRREVANLAKINLQDSRAQGHMDLPFVGGQEHQTTSNAHQSPYAIRHSPWALLWCSI